MTIIGWILIELAVEVLLVGANAITEVRILQAPLEKEKSDCSYCKPLYLDFIISLVTSGVNVLLILLYDTLL